jgi:hypothetical protein
MLVTCPGKCKLHAPEITSDMPRKSSSVWDPYLGEHRVGVSYPCRVVIYLFILITLGFDFFKI